MIPDRVEIAAEAKQSCPFCGGPAHWGFKRVAGTFSSGMERPQITIGCPGDKLWFPLAATETWAKGKGMYSIEPAARAALLEKWDTRNA